MAIRVPRGVPSITYCRISANTYSNNNGNQQSDVFSDGDNCVTISGNSSTSRHEVAQVLERGLSDEEVCENVLGSRTGSGNQNLSLNPISAVVADAVNAVFLVVGSNRCKKSLFLKKTLLPFVANELFANINDRLSLDVGGVGKYSCQVGLSCFEVQDEIITDLLRPNNRGLSVGISETESGIDVKGLHRESFSFEGEVDVRRLLADACDNRCSHTLPVGGSIDTSSAVFEFSLFQTDNSANGNRQCESRFIVVDVPSMDPLALSSEGQEEGYLKQLEGIHLHKSLLTLVEVVKKMAFPARISTAPFRNSVLTHYLTEIIVSLGMVSTGEAIISRKTLEFLGALNKSMHYPIGGRELSDTVRGLLMKYRSIVQQTQDEFDRQQSILSKSDGEEKSIHFALQNQVIQLQGQIAQLVVEKSESLEDRNRIFEMAELLKEKYTTLMTEKTIQSEELAAAEEDKLSLAKALMEEKLKASQVKESFEKEKFDLVAETVQTKGEMSDLEMTINDLKQKIGELNSQIDSLKDEQKEMKQVVQNFEDELNLKKTQLQEERDKNIDLGAELLTLVNRKEVLQTEFDNLMAQREIMSAELVELKQSVSDNADLSNKHNQEMMVKEAELLTLQKEKSALEIDNRMLKLAADELAFESRKLDSVDSSEDAAMRKEKKRQLKIVRDLENHLKRVEIDLEETTKEKISTEQELANLRHKYRDKLSSLLLKDPHDSEPYHIHKHHAHRKTSVVNNPEESIEKTEEQHSSNSSATAKLHKQLIDSYVQREENNRVQLDEVLQQKVVLKSAYRTLYDKYREAVDTIEEYLPKSSKVKPLEEIFKFGEQVLSDSNSYLSSVESEDRLNMAERVKRAESASLQETERMAFLLTTYQRNLEITETKLAATQQENVDLHIQLKQLLHGGHSTEVQSVPVTDTTDQNKYKRLYEALSVEVRELKSQLNSNTETASNESDLKSKTKLSLNIAPSLPFSSVDAIIPTINNNNNNNQLENNGSALNNQLRQVEHKHAELSMRNVALEEELKSYQTYMSEVLPQYKKQIQYLKAQLNAIKNQNTSKVESSEQLKLPQIAK